MYYINEYFGPVFVVKQLPTRMKTTVTEKVYETCGNSLCKAYGNRDFFDSFCPHCGSRCSTFDIEKKEIYSSVMSVKNWIMLLSTRSMTFQKGI